MRKSFVFKFNCSVNKSVFVKYSSMFPKFLSTTIATKYFDSNVTMLAENFVSKVHEE